MHYVSLFYAVCRLMSLLQCRWRLGTFLCEHLTGLTCLEEKKKRRVSKRGWVGVFGIILSGWAYLWMARWSRLEKWVGGPREGPLLCAIGCRSCLLCCRGWSRRCRFWHKVLSESCLWKVLWGRWRMGWMCWAERFCRLGLSKEEIGTSWVRVKNFVKSSKKSRCILDSGEFTTFLGWILVSGEKGINMSYYHTLNDPKNILYLCKILSIQLRYHMAQLYHA